MNRILRRIDNEALYHYRNGQRVKGAPTDLHGDVTGLRGDVSNLSGYVTGLRGDASDLRGNVTGLNGNVSGLSGDVTGLRGDVSGLYGDVDACGLTDADREARVDVAKLVATGKGGKV
jgi:hypothetical protein